MRRGQVGRGTSGFLCIRLFETIKKQFPNVSHHAWDKECSICEIIWDLSQDYHVRKRLLKYPKSVYDLTVSQGNTVKRKRKIRSPVAVCINSFRAKVPKEKYFELLKSME